MRSRRRVLAFGLFSLLSAAAIVPATRFAAADDGAKVVNVYSARQTNIDTQLYQLFTQKTGIRVNVTQGKPRELLERIKLAGSNGDADIFVSLDATDLQLGAQYEILQPVTSTELAAAIPAGLRDPANLWFGFSYRARLIAYDRTKIKLSKLSTYEGLADARWQSDLLTRSSTTDDVQQLVAAMIDADGQDQVDDWAKGVVQNLARRPQGSDGSQISAIISGTGAIALCSSDKLARTLQPKDPATDQSFARIGVLFPNQQDRGTHIDLAGGAVVSHAPHQVNAIKFLEFMVSPETQRLMTDTNFVYPVRADIAPNATLAAWGKFKMDDPRIAAILRNVPAAIGILDRAGWQ